MESKRQQKVGRQIQKDLGDIFQREAQHLVNGAFVTVTGVRMTPDLGIARAYLSFLPEKKKDLLFEGIQENVRFIRQKLGERVRHQLRIVPELQFYLDALFANIVIPPAEDSKEDETE